MPCYSSFLSVVIKIPKFKQLILHSPSFFNRCFTVAIVISVLIFMPIHYTDLEIII